MIRTRFAPSPTGYLHVGSLRTALFNFLFARQNNGVFILRIEDTDRERLVPGAMENLIKVLHGLGLDFDEGPGMNGSKYGPYVQSERLPIYQEHIKKLIDAGGAYYCFCTPQRLEEVRKSQESQKLPPRYDGTCRSLEPDEARKKISAGEPFVIRQKVPRTGITEYDDEVYGKVQFKNDLLDDAVLLKTDGYPVYNFANVVDDHLMEVTHVFRGEEFLSSTPKHVLLYRAFGWEAPKFVHLPLILDSQRKKLSKRTGDVAVEEYLNKGYHKEALMNFVALLGWNPKTTQEVFSLEELTKEFSLDKINKSGAIFDTAKLDYLNRLWVKKLGLMPDKDPQYARAKEILTKSLGKFDLSLLKDIWPQITERVSGPSHLESGLKEFEFYFRPPVYESSLLLWKKSSKESTAANLKNIRDLVESLTIGDFEARKTESKTKAMLAEKSIALGDALWPLRVALSGQKNSPGPFEIMEALGRDESLSRIDKAIALLKE